MILVLGIYGLGLATVKQAVEAARRPGIAAQRTGKECVFSLGGSRVPLVASS